jgi:replicative DNA helicase
MEPRELLEDAERRIFQIARDGQASEAKTIDQILAETFDRIDHLRDREGRLTGLATHYYDFDDITGGLHPGELLILAARPSMGKTSLALNLVERVARDGNGVVFFSLEMSAQQVIQNMLCSRAQIHGMALRKGRITNDQYQRLHQEAEALYEAPIFVDDSPGLSIVQARAKCRRIKQRNPEKVKLIVVDYLQLMTAGQRVESRQQEIAIISRGLKAIARELAVPVIALSQLNRDVENRDDHRPRMSDLRESGAIEQDADVVMLLHRDDYYKRTEENAGLAQVIIAKQRNGPTGEIQLRFFPEFMRFENFTRRSEPMG